MIWYSTLSAAERLEDAVRETGDQVRAVFEEVGLPDLVLAFVSSRYPEVRRDLGAEILAWTGARHLVGCTAHGVIGGGVEVEGKAALSITAARLEEVHLHGFHLRAEDLPGADAAPTAWRETLEMETEPTPHFLLLPAGRGEALERVLAGLDYAYPSSVKLGGLASGGDREELLFLDEQTHSDGLVGVGLSGALAVDAVLSSGCRPIGPVMRVSEAQGHRAMALDGRPAQEAFLELYSRLEEAERLLVQKRQVYLGVARSSFVENADPGEFLIRNLTGFDSKSGALIASCELRAGMAVRFHLRDATASCRELRQVLSEYHHREPRTAPQGALLFACAGGGDGREEEVHDESRAFAQELGTVPLGGFFSRGEIAPVGDATLVHGYTSSFGIFRRS